MKDKPVTASALAMMKEARRMMDQGQVHESLALALEALLKELNNLRESLVMVKMLSQTARDRQAPESEEAAGSGPYWVLPPKPRIIH